MEHCFVDVNYNINYELNSNKYESWNEEVLEFWLD